MKDLLNTKCIPCEGGVPPLLKSEEDNYIRQVKGWSLIRDNTHHIKREFMFKNFREAMSFVNKVADLAENEGHHPDIFIFYLRVVLELFTHAIKGLHLNDFVLAAKINHIYLNMGEYNG
ncbi:MAG: 4a-hydroxytetrahydrobiopterin dehydratase [Promethearchaeota archaeon]|jgi:4a-hydroxytetrahydrobiopterin dehydratase